MGRILVMSLAFNLPSEVNARTQELYERNRGTKFEHYIVDLGFPLEYGSDIPEDIEQAKAFNTILLKDTCKRFGSTYMKFPNIGVSQNYTQFMKAVELKADDVLICCDPDEVVHTDNWVRAIADVVGSGSSNVAYCGLCMDEQLPLFQRNEIGHEKKVVEGHNFYKINGVTSCAQWGFNAMFLLMIDGMPIPEKSSVYGYIESALYDKMKENGWYWGMLPDYIVEHGETSTLYREYKTDITSGNFTGEKQIGFEDWLKTKIFSQNGQLSWSKNEK